MAIPTDTSPSDLLRRLSSPPGVSVAARSSPRPSPCALIAIRGATRAPHPASRLRVSSVFALSPGRSVTSARGIALACAAGALGGWIALRFLRHRFGLAAAAVIAFVPAAAWACRGVFKGQTTLNVSWQRRRSWPCRCSGEAIQARANVPSAIGHRRTRRPKSDVAHGRPPLRSAPCSIYGLLGPHHVATSRASATTNCTSRPTSSAPHYTTALPA